MKDASDECNNLKLENLNKPIARISAENNCKKAFNSSDQAASGLSNILDLAIGCRVMLRKNINVSLGLVNGVLGHLVDLIYPINCGPPQVPLFAIVMFDGCEGFPSLNGNIPIAMSQASWYMGKTRCTRAQLPLSLSWACTIHKSQSLTLSKCEIDLGKVEFQAGLTYVALSRVKNESDLILINNITLTRLNSIRKSNQYKLRVTFLEWLETLGTS
ncbi:ATP-dependent DNA helicase [Frankliniella fusca]|uniref:ATP-dependent DNA helicase n=1 Tax=Frankliniella fusca TaxID=407009 RepID=A0AAE1HJN6_9NEOP|nr:ATP-dependent DNA helicase [Frankliniella fusca]